MKLLIATTNPGKFTEISRFLSDLPAELISLNDIDIHDRPIESGNSLEENAEIKALFYARKSGLPTISDDGGFEIDFLHGEPGVKSHRWIHKDRDDEDEELIAYTFKRVKHIPKAKRGAQLRVVIAFALPNGEIHYASDVIRGIIPDKPSSKRIKGFPYRSILFIPEINKYYNQDDLTILETDKYNHRKRALERLKPIIRRTLR